MILVLCTPLAVSCFVAFFGVVLAAFPGAPWHLIAIGAFAGIGQWLMADRIWERAAGMGRGRQIGVACGYLVVSALLLIVGRQLFPVPS